MSYLIIITLMVVMYAFIFKIYRGRHFYSIIMLSSWWLLWLLISEGSGGVIFPIPEVGYHVINYTLFMVLGGFVYKVFFYNKQQCFYSVNLLYLTRFSIYISIPILIALVYLVLKSLELQYVLGYSARNLRTYFFTFNENENLWFSSKLYWSLYLTFFGVIIHYILIVSLPVFHEKKKYTLLIILLLLVMLDIVLRSSRGMIYSIIVCYSYMILMAYFNFGMFKIARRDIVRGLFYFSIAAMLLVYISLQQGHNVAKNIFDYHTVSFYLFSSIIEMNGIYAYSPLEFGRLMIGGVDYFFTTGIRYIFDPEYNSPVYFNTLVNNQNVVTGSDDALVYSYHNTFYSILSSVYLDFRTAGPIFLGFITGYSLTHFERIYSDTRNTWSLIILVFIFYNSLTGIFASPLETPGFWGVVFLLMFSAKYFISKGE